MRPRLGFITAIISGALATTSCAADSDADTESISWNQLANSGITQDDRLVVFASSDPLGDEQVGYLSLVDDAGRARILKTAEHLGGKVAAREGRVCASSRDTTYELGGGSGQRFSRDGYQGSSHWIGVRSDGTCALILNSGMGDQGYETDVYWTAGEQVRRSLVPAIPGPSGQTDDAIWVRSAGLSSYPGKVRLFRTDLQTGETEVFASWATFSGKVDGVGEARNFSDGFASNLFEHGGALYYLEDLVSLDRQGDQVELKPGLRSQLRLSKVDLETGQQSSRLVEYLPDSLTAEDQGYSRMPAIAMRAGHYNDGVIYTGDSRGRILAVDLQSSTLREVGQLSQRAGDAVDADAAWDADALRLILTDSDGGITVEEYDLASGKLEATSPLSALGTVLEDGVAISGAAVISDGTS